MYTNLKQIYTNQLKMMELRKCKVRTKQREKIDSIDKIEKGKISISYLDDEYYRDEKIFKVHYITNAKKNQKESEESNSKIIENLVKDNIKNKFVEYILITNIDPKTIKILKNPDYSKIIFLFTFEEMYIFAINHCLSPIYTPVYENMMIPDEEIERMQEMSSSDIIVRILGLKKGDLIIVLVNNPVAIINEFYNVIKLIT